MLLAIAGWLLLLGGAPAIAAEGERITSYDVTLTINKDGSLSVSEAIDYDYGVNERHGIFRAIPQQVPYDKDNDRVYEIIDFRVSSSSGAPTGVSETDSDGVATFRIGDPDRTVSGRQSYLVTYTVDGTLNAFDDHDELYWNAIGDGWDVPIEAATVTVVTPAPPTQQACFTGPRGSSLPCESIDAAGGSVKAVQSAGLAPYDAFTVVVGLPENAVRATGPILTERFSLGRSLVPTPLTAALAGLILVPGLAGVGWLVGRRGRDRRYAGITPGLSPGRGTAEVGTREEPVPLAGREPVAVQFQPPEGLRPGQLGTLLDEQANVLDVTATIVDLAVRGHLRIVEQERSGWFSSRDWLLVKLAGGKGDLLSYERRLYDDLFRSGDEVLLSSLKKHFAKQMAGVQTALYSDVMRSGWFRGRPDQVRSRWKVGGMVLAAGGGWLTWVLAKHLHWAPVGIAISLVGIAVVIASSRMPARTAKGSAVLAQAKGFREYLRTAEAEQLRFEEGADIFSRYLPYAVVFGETERWVKVFGPLAAAGAAGAAGATYWYVGPNGWDPTHFGDSLDGFTSSASSTLAAATPSSSGGSGFGGGGFSGGGGGGGGGGSW